ncbi:MAG TPA: hypothetical protein VII79_02110, partial [Candidatus Dormibacteraeota bacterium]
RLETIMAGVSGDPPYAAARVSGAPSRHLEEAALTDLRAELARTYPALPEPYLPPAPRTGFSRRARRLAGRVIRRRRASRL